MEGLYDEYERVHLPKKEYNEGAATKEQMHSINVRVSNKTMKHYRKDVRK